MSAETLAHAFEPFFTTKSGLGTGLGLPTVRRIATTAGGGVDIASRPGMGTTVRLRLPLVGDNNQVETPNRPAPIQGAGHVLVVDDEPAVRRILVRQLTQEFPGVPVLCMSGTPGLTTGGSEPWSAGQIITKPADFEVVAHRIAEALGTGPLHSHPG